MDRKLTPAATLENLRKEARRWLKALRRNDPEARARLDTAYPNAPAQPVLRDVQHALAREYGHKSWIHLRQALQQAQAAAARSVTEECEQQARDLVSIFAFDEGSALQ